MKQEKLCESRQTRNQGVVRRNSRDIRQPVGAGRKIYPTKVVTFITPAAPGNSPDVVTRIVSERLYANLEATDRRSQPPPGPAGSSRPRPQPAWRRTATPST